MLRILMRDGRATLFGVAVLVLAPLASAQESDTTKDKTNDELRTLLQQALDELHDLHGRVDELEGQKAAPKSDDDDLEAQLQALLGEDEAEPAPQSPPRTVFPSAYNPRIGVFMDAVTNFGNEKEKLGTGDSFSLRETEIDLSLPLSPFAEGVLVYSIEDQGNGEFGSTIEEGYASITLADLIGVDTPARVRVGRFRLPFGRNNRLHTHDLPQVDRAAPVTYQFGEEGISGNGLLLETPLASGDAGTTSLELAAVNGDVFTGSEGLLGEAASDAGLSITSDAPLGVARVSHFVSFDPLHDLEVGATYLSGVNGHTIVTDAGTDIVPRAAGLDATVRMRDDESGQGSWLFQGELVRTNFDFGSPAAAGFPTGNEATSGWSLTAQRQIGPASYVGVRTGASDVLASTDKVHEQSAYWSWYADEFFRVRVQGQHLSVADFGADESVWRGLVQFTWNFGAHLPHPYWVNR